MIVGRCGWVKKLMLPSRLRVLQCERWTIDRRIMRTKGKEVKGARAILRALREIDRSFVPCCRCRIGFSFLFRCCESGNVDLKCWCWVRCLFCIFNCLWFWFSKIELRFEDKREKVRDLINWSWVESERTRYQVGEWTSIQQHTRRRQNWNFVPLLFWFK